jgi:hypothetical protein
MLLSTLGQLPAAVLPVLLAVPALSISIIQIEQGPIRVDDCARGNATVNIYPKNPTGYTRYNSGSDDPRPHESLNVPPNVCLSGDYPLSQNLEIVNGPICSVGTAATWAIFSNRRCSGTPSRDVYASSYIGSSWPVAPYYWSLIFRCGASPYSPVTGDVKQIDASPPIGPTKALIKQGGFRTCYGRQDGNGLGFITQQSIAVDTCHTTRDFGLRIDEAATCKNGTRAQVASFSDDKCKSPMSVNPLADLNDSDLMQCKPTGDWVISPRPKVSSPNSWKIGSISFYCDGIPEPEDDIPKPQAAAISIDACRVVPSTRSSPPTFRYPEPDTCFVSYGSPLKIYENAICPNGTSAILTQYARRGCSGTPQCFTEIGEEMLGQCLATAPSQSFSFRCTGVIQRPIQRPVRGQPQIDRGRERKATAILIAGIVMLTVGILLVVGLFLRVVFKDEKRRAKVKVSFNDTEVGNSC